MRIPSMNQMRDTHRQAKKTVDRLERLEKRRKQTLTARKVVGMVIVFLMIVPLKAKDPNILHGIVTVVAITAYIALQLIRWRQYAPVTRWRRLKSHSLAAGVAFSLIPPIVMLFNENTPDRWQLHILMWSAAAVAFLLFGYAYHKKRWVKAEAQEEAERIRRREERRRKMELL